MDKSVYLAKRDYVWQCKRDGNILGNELILENGHKLYMYQQIPASSQITTSKNSGNKKTQKVVSNECNDNDPLSENGGNE